MDVKIHESILIRVTFHTKVTRGLVFVKVTLLTKVRVEVVVAYPTHSVETHMKLL